MRLALYICATSFALYGCGSQISNLQQPSSSNNKSAAFGEPEWVQITKVSESSNVVYLEKGSIYPYKNMKMAEVAELNNGGKTYSTVAFDCSSRTGIGINLAGQSSPELPIHSWSTYAKVFNYVCFGQLEKGLEAQKTNVDLPEHL